MGKISVYFNSGKIGLADRSARMMVKNRGISVGFWVFDLATTGGDGGNFS